MINYERNIGGNWNQNATLNTIQGNFFIKKTGTVGQSFRLTSTATLNLTIGGSLEVERGNLTVKDNLAFGTTSLVQVNGDLIVTEGILDLGTVNLKPDNELRFKGNLFVFDNGVLTSQSENPFLVANGTSLQIFYSGSIFNCSFKIARGASMKITSAVNMGIQRSFVVAGTCNVGINPIIMNSGQLIVSGGQLNSSGNVDMKDGTCQVCRGDGTFNILTNYCTTTGDTGQFNFSTDTIFFNRRQRWTQAATPPPDRRVACSRHLRRHRPASPTETMRIWTVLSLPAPPTIARRRRAHFTGVSGRCNISVRERCSSPGTADWRRSPTGWPTSDSSSRRRRGRSA